MDVINNILGATNNFNPGQDVGWDYGDGSAKVLKKNNKGVTFFVQEFGQYGTGEQHQVKKSWAWIKNNIDFFK